MDKYQAIEHFIGAHNADEVKKHFQITSDTEDWELAIQVHIACGDRKDLEDAFPEFSGANPANHNWN